MTARKKSPLPGSYPLIGLLAQQLGEGNFMFHCKNEQGVEHRTGKSGSLAAARVGLQFVHQNIELRATPE